jgi:hypothetical protein
VKFQDELGIRDFDYPLPMGHSIKQIESYIEKLKDGKFRITQKVEVPKGIDLFQEKEVQVEFTLVQLQHVITGAEAKLSRYLESKLLTTDRD